MPKRDATRVNAALVGSLRSWAVIADQIVGPLADVGQSGIANNYARMRITDEGIMDRANAGVLEYAAERSAELVGMRRTSTGRLVPNPNKQYAITETTRREVRALVLDAFREGLSRDELAAALETYNGFGAERAVVIAQTEMSFANSNANMTAWRASGVVTEKEWLVAQEPCETCQANADQGRIPFGEEFQSGHMAHPAHPKCYCDTAAYTDEGALEALAEAPGEPPEPAE